MNRLKLNLILDYIRSRAEFPFNLEDVEEDLHEVLGFFDVFEAFSPEESRVLRQELGKMAVAEEEREVARMLAESSEGSQEALPPQFVSPHEDKLRV